MLRCVARPNRPIAMTHYLRIAKTASSTALAYFGETQCSRSIVVHKSHYDFSVPASNRSVVVLREPCDRARSQLAHIVLLGSLITWKNSTLHLSPAPSLLAFAEWVAASGIAHARRSARPATILFAQSRYVRGNTEVICFPNLEPALQRLCGSTRQLPRVNQGVRRVNQAEADNCSRRCTLDARRRCAAANRNATLMANGIGCDAVRTRAYAEDWALYRQHCLPNVLQLAA